MSSILDTCQPWPSGLDGADARCRDWKFTKEARGCTGMVEDDGLRLPSVEGALLDAMTPHVEAVSGAGKRPVLK